MSTQPDTELEAAAWEETPLGIDRHWLVTTTGAIIGHAGSCNMGGGAPFYARTSEADIAQFTTLERAMQAVCKALAPSAQLPAEPASSQPFVDDSILRDMRLFLESLPRDLGRGSLNGMLVQLEYKVNNALSATTTQPASDQAYVKAERRAIMFGDIVAQHTIAMGAAVVEGHLTSPEAGMQWIVNTLAGPGHLPDLDEARQLGGAQAWFDAKMAEHDAFREAHPAPTVALTPPAQVAVEPAAWKDVLAERKRQIEVEGWTPDHDEEHDNGAMAKAAACYALHTEPVGNVGDYLRFWPWASSWWKPKNRRHNLVRAGALILAEIERLDRASPTAPASTGAGT